MNCKTSAGALDRRSRSTCWPSSRLLWIGLLSLCLGCLTESEREIVVYTALDAPFSQPIFDKFEQQTGIRVLAKFDVESTKTVGLANALLAEAARPRCDVFWNNEILNTLRLKRAGLLAPYPTRQRERFPDSFVGQDHTWFGFAARARVILINTDRIGESSARPSSVLDLANPEWQDQAAIAKPLFGTTATHATVLFDVWGMDRAANFFAEVHQNVRVLSGNKQVALAVARGQVAWGFTDTDDAIIELEKGMPVEIIYPDQGPAQLGTLLIPNTLGIIQNGPHPGHAQQLVDFLLSEEVETQLAASRSAQIPLGRDAPPHRLKMPEQLRVMSVDFESAAEKWDEVAKRLRDIFMRVE